MILSVQTEQGLKWKGNVSELVWKLPSGDIETLLIKIRENTYGPRFYHEAHCTNCGHNNKNLRLDLDKLSMDCLSVQELLSPKVITLPKSKQEVELKAVYLKDLFDVIKITSSKQDSLITSLASVSIKRVGDNASFTQKDIEEMSAKDLVYITEQVENIKLEGHIDTDIEINCSKCEQDFKVKLNCFDSSFFSPTRASTNSST
jgi:hypothetical protein